MVAEIFFEPIIIEFGGLDCSDSFYCIVRKWVYLKYLGRDNVFYSILKSLCSSPTLVTVLWL